MEKRFFVYILSNRKRTVLYTGVTNDLHRRLQEHRSEKPTSFTQRYRVRDLVYYESYPSINDAISREKQIKGWKREKKLRMILLSNRYMKDLSLALE